MHRDKNLVRKLLLAIEAKPDDQALAPEDLKIDEHSSSEINFHLALMEEGGLISSECFHSNSNPRRIVRVAQIYGLSWKGFEWLDSIRDLRVWDQALGIAKHSEDAPFELVIEVANRLARRQLLAQVA